MLMAQQRGGSIHELMTVNDNLKQPFGVRTQIIDCGIKTARLAQIISFKRHTGTGAITTRQIRIERMFAAMLFQIENDLRKSFAKATILLKKILRLRLKLHWQNIPRHTYH